MRTLVRMVAALSLCVVAFGVASIVSAGGRPAPPPPVLCGCACPDGSFVTTHAANADSCPSACATACQGSEEM